MKADLARVTDVDTLAVLFDEYRQFYKQPSDLRGAREFLRDRISHGESYVFCVRDGEKILGFAQLYPTFSSVSMKRLWILNDLFVLPTARGQGVAKLLLTTAADFARASGARGLTLKTARDNTPAQKLYEACGWKRDDRFYSYDWVAS